MERDSQTHSIIGAAMRVHSELGCGFLEAVYQEALALELAEAAIPFEREVLIAVRYRGRALSCRYRADFVCYGDVLVELKATARLETIHEAQVLNYLKATGFPKALLFNFGETSLRYKRLVGPANLPR